MARFKDSKQNLDWHVGERIPGKYVYCTNFSDIISLYADEDELKYILQNFHGIPSTNFRFCKWTGETAAFIFYNLVTINFIRED